jgi:two-component system response regulator HydG
MNQQSTVFALGKAPILIVDDDRDTCELINYFLSSDFDCDMAFDGEQALERVRERDYSVVLVDLMLPKVDGFALIKSVAEKSPATPVIVVSAVADVNAAIRAMKMGAFAYIVKPFYPEQVEISVKRAFNHHRSINKQHHPELAGNCI